MTKEQEGAVEIVEKIVKNYIEADECGLLNNDFKHEIRALQIVLSMLAEKDKVIEKLRRKNKDLLRKLRNRIKEVEKLKRYSLYKKEFSNLNKRIDKKDRIIDEMAEKLNQAYCDENDYWDWFEERFGRIPDGSYAKQIKQYFERKIEE